MIIDFILKISSLFIRKRSEVEEAQYLIERLERIPSIAKVDVIYFSEVEKMASNEGY